MSIIKKMQNGKVAYDPVVFWNHKKQPNSPMSPEKIRMDVDYVKKHLCKSYKVLDFGCGDGRLFDAYTDVYSVVGYDISNKYKKTIKKKAMNYDFIFKHIVEKQIKKLPFVDGKTKKEIWDAKHFDNNRFDAVVCTYVLLHQKPNDVESIMKELLRVGKKVIVITYYEEKPPMLIKSNFNHNYIEICKRNNWEILDRMYDETDGGLFFVYQ